ncbi:hypothetical protein AB2L27_13280 [Kineococcus sp. LSe6-4]|uniref:Uncharacterized protein n=1 Tax=Kineococcus halophytocola TaxID=3234027 RepID=A0ABV4H4H6_9ACTN
MPTRLSTRVDSRAAAGHVVLLLCTGRDALGDRDRVREAEIVGELLRCRVDGVVGVGG